MCITKFVHILIHVSHCISNMATKYFRALSYYNFKKTKLIACDRCFSSDVKIVDTFVNKPSFVFILLFILRAEFFTCVNPPLGNFTHVLIFFPSKNLTLKFYNIYTHLKHLLVI